VLLLYFNDVLYTGSLVLMKDLYILFSSPPPPALPSPFLPPSCLPMEQDSSSFVSAFLHLVEQNTFSLVFLLLRKADLSFS
jgi:hypothetical protein